MKSICKVAVDGYKEWHLNGKLHREDGPAVEHPTGYKAWYLNGKRHREEGPAVESPEGYKAWYLNGKRYEPTIEQVALYEWHSVSREYRILTKKLKEEKELICMNIEPVV